MYQSTKTFHNYPCAHRQYRHKGNCALVHGYSRAFHFVFEGATRDSCGFVVDFGDLKWLKDFLEDKFDHTLLLPPDDPELSVFEALAGRGACKLVVLPYGVGMEDTAQFIGEWADNELRTRTKGRCWIVSVESRENDKNSGIWYNPSRGFIKWL